MDGRLGGKVALVTGGGSGIGRASAVLFAREGARVAVLDLREAAARETAAAIEAAGGQALALGGDVASDGDQAAAVGATVARWGRLDVYFANAGLPQAPTSIEDVEETMLDRLLAVNVKGVVLSAKHAAPVMKGQRTGVFLATASTSAARPRPRVQCYSASKGAVVSLVKSLALELAPFGVRAAALAPVATETPMLPTFSGKARIDDELMAKYLATIPLGRLNQPEDVARAALFLASDDAAMLTGVCLEVDGGRSV
jgi:3-oxoacyl-[acyl-carrier protein] reductase